MCSSIYLDNRDINMNWQIISLYLNQRDIKMNPLNVPGPVTTDVKMNMNQQSHPSH